MAGTTLTPALWQAWEREKAERLEEVDGTALAYRRAAGAVVYWKLARGNNPHPGPLWQAWEREKAERLEEVRVPASPFSCAAAAARATRFNCREYAPAKLPQGSETGAQKGDKGAAWLLYLIVRKRVSACCLIYGSVGERSKPPDCKSGAVMATEVRILPGPPR